MDDDNTKREKKRKFNEHIAYLIIKQEKDIRHRTYKSMIDEMFRYYCVGKECMTDESFSHLIDIFYKEKRKDLIDLITEYRRGGKNELTF